MASSGMRRRIVYLDGFAGPGVYRGGEEGSPILALRTLLEHPQFRRWGGIEFQFLFFEPDEDRFASLDSELDAFQAARAPWPKNVIVIREPMPFADGAH